MRGGNRVTVAYPLMQTEPPPTAQVSFFTEMVCLKSSRFLKFFEIFIKFFIGYDHSP